MPSCPTCEAFFPTLELLSGHSKTDCQRWTKSQVFAIAIVQCDGTKNEFAKLKGVEVIGKLASELLQGPSGRGAFCMLLAPEFYFWNPVGKPAGTFSSRQLDQCFEGVTLASAKLGNVLLVPGTVPVADLGTFSNLLGHYGGRKKASIMPDDDLPEGVKKKYLGEEFDDQQSKVSQFQGGAYRYRNVAGAFFGGAQLLAYHKQIPFYDVSTGDFEYHWFLDKDAMVLDAPPSNPNSITVDGVRVGFEICAEHQYGTLKASGRGFSDVHVLLANSMEEYFPTLVNTRPSGGLFAHVDAQEEHSALYYCASGKVKKVKPTKAGVLNDGGFKGSWQLYLVQIRIPIRMK